ncbi:hypothetical protein GCM10011400_35470 [Paraburkholderia caffeinilytica]|uniref:Uncharacterized protein n=1 Tax=Paraburkholderia caffeinilytica TaxID=1761016 RepID=A0ABQ1MR93_9BURK|nr:hypothetical protein GCM10011400_35470 [Paraburkholderia caffeinilytica]
MLQGLVPLLRNTSQNLAYLLIRYVDSYASVYRPGLNGCCGNVLRKQAQHAITVLDLYDPGVVRAIGTDRAAVVRTTEEDSDAFSGPCIRKSIRVIFVTRALERELCRIRLG